jgi:serine/threonine-protein kinase
VSAADAAGRVIFPESWSADGQLLSLSVYTRGKGEDVAIYSMRDKRVTPIVASRFDEWGGQLSPDGKWLAYISTASGRPEAYVRAVEGSGATFPVSHAGAEGVVWTSGARELVTLGEGGAFTVAFTPGPTPVLGKPVPLLGGKTGAAIDGVIFMTPAPDGKRFVAVFEGAAAPLKEIRVITNWTPAR